MVETLQVQQIMAVQLIREYLLFLFHSQFALRMGMDIELKDGDQIKSKISGKWGLGTKMRMQNQDNIKLSQSYVFTN